MWRCAYDGCISEFRSILGSQNTHDLNRIIFRALGCKRLFILGEFKFIDRSDGGRPEDQRYRISEAYEGCSGTL
ncbi:protein of unknown function [Acidithiobacillus ferrivorans]|uniref:Uncharacterized protein n=1 Tax=Acidithiobacillus ferrivorans TaxID=160808 RepID=A0A060UPD3_9PROT|nr:hypothetical protein AFERRI_40088 [Acidithiobacillus ferrivorans]SMH64095.1 protein of unknown function [Acidithiobacillus ferrivorans]